MTNNKRTKELKHENKKLKANIKKLDKDLSVLREHYEFKDKIRTLNWNIIYVKDKIKEINKNIIYVKDKIKENE